MVYRSGEASGNKPENGVRLPVALHFTELRQDLFKFIGSFKTGLGNREEGYVAGQKLNQTNTEITWTVFDSGGWLLDEGSGNRGWERSWGKTGLT